MESEKESPKERLLEACGVEQPPLSPPGSRGQERQMHFEAMLARAETAAMATVQAQDRMEKACNKLNGLLEVKLPGQLRSAFESVAREQVNQVLSPLNAGINQAAFSIKSCAEGLESLSWNGRIMRLTVLIGVCTVSVGAVLVRCTLFDEKLEEAKRYEVFGRKVEALIGRYKPKEQERIYRWIGSRP